MTYQEVSAGGVPAIWAIPEDSSTDHVFFHSHSGGSMVASMYLERKAIGHLAKKVGARALILNFRLAPEYKFPAQMDDVETAYRWLLDQGYDPAKIASVGGSIGGGYAVLLPLALLRKNAATGQDTPLPAAVLAMSPSLDLELKNPAITANASKDKMLSAPLMASFQNAMLDGSGFTRSDPEVSAQNADPTGLPPTMIYYGEYEVLADDGPNFAEKARKVGVDIEVRCLPEAQHIFYLGAGRVPEVDAAIAAMAAWLRSKIGLAPA